MINITLLKLIDGMLVMQMAYACICKLAAIIKEKQAHKSDCDLE